MTQPNWLSSEVTGPATIRCGSYSPGDYGDGTHCKLLCIVAFFYHASLSNRNHFVCNHSSRKTGRKAAARPLDSGQQVRSLGYELRCILDANVFWCGPSYSQLLNVRNSVVPVNIPIHVSRQGLHGERVQNRQSLSPLFNEPMIRNKIDSTGFGMPNLAWELKLRCGDPRLFRPS